MAVALVLALAGTVALGGCTRNQEAFTGFQLVNAERHAAGVAPLSLDDALVDKAQAWAETLAAWGSIHHSALTEGVPDGWYYVAENVGWAHSPEEAHALLMASPKHRANILDGRSNRIGTGAAWSGDRLFVVQVFAGY